MATKAMAQNEEEAEQVWEILNLAARKKVLRITGGWESDAEKAIREMGGSQADAVTDYLTHNGLEDLATTTSGATVKLEVTAFNVMAGRAKVIEQIDQIFGENRWRPYDSERQYWRNASDTLVLAISKGAKVIRNAKQEIEAGKAWHDLSADEVDSYDDEKEGDTIIRFWWD